MLGKVIFDEHVNALEKYCKGEYHTHLQNLIVIALFLHFKVRVET